MDTVYLLYAISILKNKINTNISYKDKVATYASVEPPELDAKDFNPALSKVIASSSSFDIGCGAPTIISRLACFSGAHSDLTARSVSFFTLT